MARELGLKRKSMSSNCNSSIGDFSHAANLSLLGDITINKAPQ